MNLALIPARGLSQRVPSKNLVDVCGRPLLEWTILQAQQTKLFDVIAVSTEDQVIAREAVRCGAEVIKRPMELAMATSLSWDVAKHAFSVMPCDLQILLQPTSPLRTADDISGAVDEIDLKRGDSVISVTDELPGKRPMLFSKGHAGRIRVERIPYVENGAIFGITGEALARGHDWYSGIVYHWYMPVERSLDIDTLEDLELARRLMARREAA